MNLRPKKRQSVYAPCNRRLRNVYNETSPNYGGIYGRTYYRTTER